MTSEPAQRRRTSRLSTRVRVRFAVGLVLGLAVPFLLGELLVRHWPPADLHDYLGEDSPKAGIYRADPVLGADYRSVEQFRQTYAKRLDALGPLPTPLPGWALFGSSFVQAPGMLGDTAQAAFPRARMFYLARNEPLHLRVAQARLLLASGLRPQRILFVMVVLDAVPYATRPLSAIEVNARGAVTSRIRPPPPPFDRLVASSRLALLAWVRSGRSVWNPGFKPNYLMERVPPGLSDDLGRMLGELGERSRDASVPVTLVLIPNREQIFGRGGFAIQDELIRLGARAGLDVYDARAVFQGEADKRSLFVPDWHFSPRGNQLLLSGVLAHLRAIGAPDPVETAEVRP